MDRDTSQGEIIHTFSEGKDERHTNSVSKEQYLIECENQLVRQRQFLKIMALGFHHHLGRSYRNLLQNSESKDLCCHIQEDLRQMILDHENRLVLYFDSVITKLLDLKVLDSNRLTAS